MASSVAKARPRGPYGEARPTDRQVIHVVCNGDAEAFAMLVERYYGALTRHLTYHTGDCDVALDLAQETFADAFRDLERFDASGTFAAWLYGIAHNRLRAYWKRQRVRRFISLDWFAGSAEAPPLALRQPDGSEPCHERVILSHVLAGLSLPLRDALLLHSLDGFTAPEVAGILGISCSAAERRVSRAKEQFRQRYHELTDNA
jgi:RNA polymerase sigma-70 factor (ECF subfamily)